MGKKWSNKNIETVKLWRCEFWQVCRIFIEAETHTNSSLKQSADVERRLGHFSKLI